MDALVKEALERVNQKVEAIPYTLKDDIKFIPPKSHFITEAIEAVEALRAALKTI